MAMNGPNEAPNTITTTTPRFTKLTGEKSHKFTPNIFSCLSANLTTEERNCELF